MPTIDYPCGMVEPAGCGVPLASRRSSQWFVLNGNSMQGNSLPNNPYALYRSTHANDTKIYPIQCPKDLLYLDMYHLTVGSADAALKVLVWLRHPFNPPSQDPNPPQRILPFDVDPTNYILHDCLWVPGQDPQSGAPNQSSLEETGIGFDMTTSTGQVVAALIQALTTASATYPNVGGITSQAAASVKAFNMTGKRTIYLAGAETVLVAVKAAASGPTRGLIVGRFVS